MNFKQLLFGQTLLTCFLTTLLSGAIGFPLTSLKAQAQGFGQPPGTNKSGGVRGGCAAAFEGRQLIALVENGKSTFSQPELTTKEYPTLFFYLPLARNPNFTTKEGQVYSLTSVEFELQDEYDNPVLKNQKLVFSLPNQPGIVSLKLPRSESPLEPNKAYFWVFRIICDRYDNSANPTVAGWIKRVSPGSSDNVWFDRLKNLVESRTNFLDDWTKLLAQFELLNLAQGAIVELQPEAQNNYLPKQ
ncbi:MAG TPA: hypothetical protein DCE56_05310 [Cyanobacteria bacterium UBA8553]|nr:hypothetical protein [Cyanobacteria bacterium UBA8553]HAJ59979.1 hypothetical protein [Cyanobacteria bacterium UBA8543]